MKKKFTQLARATIIARNCGWSLFIKEYQFDCVARLTYNFKYLDYIRGKEGRREEGKKWKERSEMVRRKGK